MSESDSCVLHTSCRTFSARLPNVCVHHERERDSLERELTELRERAYGELRELRERA
jgi:hypothetical protein